MKICFPVQNDNGIESTVYNHFGSAPVFVVVDTDTNCIASINNRDQHHSHGACNPMKALDNQKVDAIVVGGIGRGALTRLNQMGNTVHRSGDRLFPGDRLQRKIPDAKIEADPVPGGRTSSDFPP